MRLKQNPERSGDSLHQAAAAPSYYCPLLAEAPSCTPHLLSRRRRGANMEDRKTQRKTRSCPHQVQLVFGGGSLCTEGGRSLHCPPTHPGGPRPAFLELVGTAGARWVLGCWTPGTWGSPASSLACLISLSGTDRGGGDIKRGVSSVTRPEKS